MGKVQWMLHSWIIIWVAQWASPADIGAEWAAPQLCPRHPPINRHRRRPPRFASSRSEEREPRTRWPVMSEDANARAGSPEPGHAARRGSAAAPCCSPPGATGPGAGAGALRRGTSGETRSPPPRAASGGPCDRHQARPPAAVALGSQPGWRVGGQTPAPANGGGGRGGRRPCPEPLRTGAPRAPLSVPAGEESSSPSPRPPEHDSWETRAHREILGAPALPLLHASAAAASPPQLPGLHLEPPGTSGSGVGPAPGSGRGAGHGQRRLRRPPVAGPTVCSTRERTTPRAAAAPHRPLPARDAPQPGAGTRAWSRGDRWTLAT